MGKTRKSAKPNRLSASSDLLSLLRCPEKRRRGTEGWGKGQESGQ